MRFDGKINAHILGAVAIIFAAALWGVDGIVLRPSLYHLNVTVVVFLEHFIAFMIMTVVLFKSLNELKKVKHSDLLYFFWIALFGGAIGTMAITQALFLVNFQDLSAILILQKLQPLFAIIVAAILLKERPRKDFYGWALVAIAGSYLITFGFNSPVFEGNAFFIAALLSFIAAFSWGSCTAVGKKAVTNVSFKTATYIRFGLTSAIMFVILMLFGTVSQIPSVGIADIETLILIALTTGGTAIFIYYWGLKRVLASKATIYELSFPITAILLDYIINKSIMSPGQWLGAALIIVSMLMITRKRSYEDEERTFYE